MKAASYLVQSPSASVLASAISLAAMLDPGKTIYEKSVGSRVPS